MEDRTEQGSLVERRLYAPNGDRLLRSEIFVNDYGQFRAVHLILDFKPISKSFLDVGNSIRAGDHRLARIDISRPDFLAPYDLPSVDHHIPQGIPLVTQPLQ